MLGLICFLILVLILGVFLKKQGSQNTMHEMMGGILNKGEYKSKYYMDSFISVIKSKAKLPDLLKGRSSSFDYITFNILQAKKDIMSSLYPNLSLEECIKQRPFDKSQFEEALLFEGCSYDREVELLNSLVHLDEDEVLSMPFYNEPLLKAKILNDALSILQEEHKKDGDLFRSKCEVVKMIKDRYKDIYKGVVDSVLVDELDL